VPAPARKPPKVFISYSHDSPQHMERVLEFADRLRDDGVDATIDQYEVAPPEGWPIWMARQIKQSDFVLLICTDVYLKRVERREEPGKGDGVKWESVLSIQEIYDAGSNNEKFIAVLLDGAARECIPDPLRPWPHYRGDDEQGYLDLYRRLTNQPFVTKPDVGQFRSLPQRQRRTASLAAPAAKPWNVPQERNPVFTGREEILQELRADLVKNCKQALSAMGGMGKTQIAIEYAYRHEKDYSAVLWTFADTEQSISSGFAKIAALLTLPEKDSTEQAAVTAAVRRWLEEHDGWLMVFDNSDQPELLKSFLPQPQRGHVLLTSRNQVFQSIGIINPREVSVLTPAAAREFLLKRTGHDPNKKSSDADALAKELGYYPLALEQAGAYMVENQASFAAYLAGFKKRRLKLFEQKAVIGDYEKTVTTTWALNFEEIAQGHPASADLLRLSAFLAPDAIPLELIEKGKSEMGEPISASLADSANDPLALDELLKPLTIYSLIRRDLERSSYNVHLMVQEVVRGRMNPDEQKTWAERAVCAVNAAFPGTEFQNWPACDRFLAHALASASWILRAGLGFLEAGQLSNQAAFYLFQRAQYSEAEPLLKGSLAIREKALGPKHPDTALSLNNLAQLYHAQGKYDQAVPLNQRALAICEEALGPEHQNTATTLNNLAELYRVQQKHEQAEPLHRRALVIREKHLGPDHPDTATSLNDLALLYLAQEKYEQAEPLYERALAAHEKALGPEHPNTATIVDNLATLYRARGKHEQAKALSKRALAIRETALGPEHPDTAISLNNLALLYDDQGNHSQAERLFKRALDILDKALGPKHPDTLLCASNLVVVYRAMGKAAEADELNRRFPKTSEAKSDG
jgi:tetratricopeptide (TPR) repeat protein